MPKDEKMLLQQFEPVLRFTRGEQFFPMDVEPYVKSASLWVQSAGHKAKCIVPVDELTLSKLGTTRPRHLDEVQFLKFIEPLNVAELAAYYIRKGLNRQEQKNAFHPGYGRLTRVGYISRLVDAFIALSLLGRGRVPGDTAAAAIPVYKKIATGNFPYYGRVIKQNDWLVLQYWFFYAFNNWRSSFFGVNDHEADWEMICVYLYETNENEIEPAWVAYATHDFHGDDLRRRWDDPVLEKIGSHPIVYVAAGSHASYYTAGEYLTEIELPFLSPVNHLNRQFHQFWRNLLGDVSDKQFSSTDPNNTANIFRIPFVDYARGDGFSIGPGQHKDWGRPYLLNPTPPWVANYHGLWGLYARDPVSGENAPAGPMYNRDGTIRQAWYDPVGWSGLDKTPPPTKMLAYLHKRTTALKEQQETLQNTILHKNNLLIQLGMETSAIQSHANLQKIYQTRRQDLQNISSELHQARQQFATNQAVLHTLQDYAIQLEQGNLSNPRAHISRVRRPVSEVEVRWGRFTEMWAAISIGLLMIGFVILLIFAPNNLIWGLIILLFFVTFIEASTRSHLTQFIDQITIFLAIIASIILLYEFFWEIVVLSVLLAGGYIIRENLRELFT